jgi:hypothetical protein
MLFLNKNYKFLFFSFLCLLIFYRSPYIFLNGRFIAEEGQWWFSNVFINGSLSGITYIYWGSNYFNFWANISSVVASLFPLEYAPLGTVYMALFVKLYLLIYILYSESNFLVKNIDKTIISLLIILAPTMTSTIWLNTLVSQIYLSIFVILVFFQKNDSNNFFNRSSIIILIISGMTSLISCIFTPFFFLKYLAEKNKENFISFLCLLIPTFIQSYIFIYSNLNDLSDQNRFLLTSEKFLNFIYNVFAKSFLGTDLTKFIYFDIFKENKFTILIVISILLISFIFLVFKNNFKDKILFYLIIFLLVQSILAVIAAKFDQVQGRYAVIPSVLLLFCVYRFYQINKNYFRYICFSLIILSLLTGFFEYKINNNYPQLLSCLANCPNWKDEVKKWRENNDYELRIWDYPRKKMSLNKLPKFK